jgi:hypothetical protein
MQMTEFYANISIDSGFEAAIAGLGLWTAIAFWVLGDLWKSSSCINVELYQE